MLTFFFAGADTSRTVMVALASTESTPVVAVWLVANTTTESTCSSRCVTASSMPVVERRLTAI